MNGEYVKLELQTYKDKEVELEEAREFKRKINQNYVVEHTQSLGYKTTLFYSKDEFNKQTQLTLIEQRKTIRELNRELTKSININKDLQEKYKRFEELEPKPKDGFFSKLIKLFK